MTRDGKKAKPADLAALKKALAEKEAAAKAAKPAQPPAPRRPPPRKGEPPAPSPPPAEPEVPVSFDDEMKRMGVAPAGSGAARVVVVPPVATGPSPASGAGAPGVRPATDEELWAQSMQGVRGSGKGVERKPRGRITALPTLDLHGFVEEDARHELSRFVGLHRGAEPKWVRVITGRGLHGAGVLRNAARRWLDASTAVAHVRTAPPEEGGDGVLLVQLRKATRP